MKYNYFNPLGWLILIIVMAIYLIYRRIRRTVAVRSEDGPLLSSTEMLNSSGLQSVHKGVARSLNYDLMANEAGIVMVFVDLGRKTDLHLLAIGDKSNINSLVTEAISNKWLKPVRLEGDFPDYFSLYASPNKELEVLELFDPTTMAGFIDFCRDYDFEIFNDELFISQSKNKDTGDSNDTLITTIEAFLQKNAEVISKL